MHSESKTTRRFLKLNSLILVLFMLILFVGCEKNISEGKVSEYLGLELDVTSIDKSDGYTSVFCIVKNVSSKYGAATRYRYINVEAIFYDRHGNIVDSQRTYAVGSSWLNSGETKHFFYMVRDTSVKSVKLSII